MKQTRLLMDMPVTIEIADKTAAMKNFEEIYDYFHWIDDTFSVHKATSEISRINQGKLSIERSSPEVQNVLKLCDQTRMETDGYFDVRQGGQLDPSGLVKGWAIRQAAQLLTTQGWGNFYIEAGGDIQVRGHDAQGQSWRIGIRHPFEHDQIVKVITVQDEGVATSGTYVRGQHVYDPFHPGQQITEIVSLTVIAPDVYEADRFATAAFAMGRDGIAFIEKKDGLDGYMIDHSGIATFTSGFPRYTMRS